MIEIINIAIPAFITLFVVIDPLGIAPVFSSLTEGTTAKHQRLMALKGTFVGAIILFFFAFVGKSFLSALGIEMDSFRTAGGLMLFLIAVEMVFEKRTKRRKKRVGDVSSDEDDNLEDEDISIFPIGVPLVAGPGSIGAIMLLMGGGDGSNYYYSIILGTLVFVLLLTLLIFILAGKVTSIMGPGITKALTRVFGIVLSALAVQLVFDGIKGSFL